jgi:acetyltransferase-like isoleucine patch superfamily enzyme
MKRYAEILYLIVSILGQLVIGVLLGIAAVPSFYFLLWSWQSLSPAMNTVLGALGIGLSLGIAFLIFGNSLLILILVVRNLFGLRNHEQRAKLVSLVTVKTALYNLMLHVANHFFLSVLKGSYISLLFYRGMGAKIGKGTLIATHRIWDCDLVEIGENCVIGGNSSISAHVAQGDRGRLRKVLIGNNVTIGANASVMPGVVIEDSVVVGANSLVPMGMHLEAGKTYIGVPVKPVG